MNVPKVSTEKASEVDSRPAKIDSQKDRIEAQILQLRSEVVALRASRPNEVMPDYQFKSLAGVVDLADLFGARSDLILIHNMGKACSYCTLWADGLNGLLPHLESRAAFVVVSPDRPEVQQELAQSRKWLFRMVSDDDSKFTRDMGFLDGDGDPMPGLSTFHKSSDNVQRIQRAEFGPGDLFCAVWHMFDLLEGGINEWEPKPNY